ncbi:hypothetical protein M3Y96_00678500 [Aphelenchoides besseyi]|nr:hypothetical protein M3Y96_00678500 [Aphelenchoides besseyi]
MKNDYLLSHDLSRNRSQTSFGQPIKTTNRSCCMSMRFFSNLCRIKKSKKKTLETTIPTVNENPPVQTLQRRNSRLKKSGIQPSTDDEAFTSTTQEFKRQSSSRQQSVRKEKTFLNRKCRKKNRFASQQSTRESENDYELKSEDENDSSQLLNVTKDNREKPPRPPLPEFTTISSEEAANIHELELLGKIDVDVEKIKSAAMEFANFSLKLTAKVMPKNTTKENFDKNPTRNRYRDVICTDHERVVLTPLGSNTCDYIHANHIRGPPLNNQHFICTQEPTATTLNEFWRMVLQENIRAILMLCVSTEKRAYWPVCNQQIMKLEDIGILVTNRGSFVHTPGLVTTVLEVINKNSDDLPHKVYHHQYKNFPDRGVPEKEDIVLRLLQLIRSSSNESAVVIHCSAGIGRTGIVMSAELCIQTLIANKTPQIAEIVRALREKRLQSVQTDLQYLFIYRLVLAFIRNLIPDAELTKTIDTFTDTFNAMNSNKRSIDNGHSPVISANNLVDDNVKNQILTTTESIAL